MRVNIYAEEMTDRVELVEKDGHVGLRFYLYLPTTTAIGEQMGQYIGPLKPGDDPTRAVQVKGPFIHHPGDDDSAAVTFWGKRAMREALVKAIALLDAHYAGCVSDPSGDHLSNW